MTYNETIHLIYLHGWEPDDCTVSHTIAGGPWDGNLTDHESWDEDYCESFHSYFGKHESYDLIDVKNWLGY